MRSTPENTQPTRSVAKSRQQQTSQAQPPPSTSSLHHSTRHPHNSRAFPQTPARAHSHSRCCRAGTFIKFDLRHAMNMRALPVLTFSSLCPTSSCSSSHSCSYLCFSRPRDSFRIVFFNMFVCLSDCLSPGTNNRVHH